MQHSREASPKAIHSETEDPIQILVLGATGVAVLGKLPNLSHKTSESVMSKRDERWHDEQVNPHGSPVGLGPAPEGPRQGSLASKAANLSWFSHEENLTFDILVRKQRLSHGITVQIPLCVFLQGTSTALTGDRSASERRQLASGCFSNSH